MALSSRAPKLELSTLDLCFLATLYLRGQSSGHAAFSEEQLFEHFEQAAQVVERDPSSVRKRATHAIARLRQQRLLARVDGAGLLRAGEYALSRLGVAIVSFYLEDEVLTTETLTLLTRTLESSLRDVLLRAHAARDRARAHGGHRAPAARPGSAAGAVPEGDLGAPERRLVRGRRQLPEPAR